MRGEVIGEEGKKKEETEGRKSPRLSGNGFWLITILMVRLAFKRFVNHTRATRLHAHTFRGEFYAPLSRCETTRNTLSH